MSTVKYTGTVKIPFVATFSSGNKTWYIELRFSSLVLSKNSIFVFRELNGEYTGKDSTNIKLVFNQVI